MVRPYTEGFRQIAKEPKIDYNDPLNGYLQYEIGTKVIKHDKDETYVGFVLSRFLTLDRKLRFAIEVNGTGIIKIEKGADLYWFNAENKYLTEEK